MGALSIAFKERLAEIESYLDFLQEVENTTRLGVPKFAGSGAPVTVQQTRMLYSSVYLQLYNLIEATVTKCLDGLTETSITSGAWVPGDIIAELRREWVRVIAGSHRDLNYDNRLKQAFELCEHLIGVLPLDPFKIEKGGGGNWDDKGIEAIAARVGVKLRVSAKAKRAVKEKFRDDRGALGVVVKLRNDLAHGSLSFAECGENTTVAELRELTHRAATYMEEVVAAFEAFIDGHEFLIPAKRPAVA
jgi:hypothetical protein